MSFRHVWFGLQLCWMIGGGTGAVDAAPVVDPAPPKFVVPGSTTVLEPQGFDRLKFHQAPKPLSPQAVVSDWPRFLGPADNATSPEKPLLKSWSDKGPTLLWEVRKGDGYTSPVMAGDWLILFHALEGRETIECLHRETGKRLWMYDYEAAYRDRYGYSNGPRGSPVIVGDRVITLGVTSMLTCLDLRSGQLCWRRDLRTEFETPQDFFGHGSSPLVMGEKVIVNVGGKKPMVSVAAFDLKTGALVWGLEDEWGASYASPIATTLHGKTKLLVFAGGESNPAVGGLMCIDPDSGALHDRFPWRADDYISVNATSPVVIPDRNRVFVSTCYPKRHPLGGVMVEFDENFKAREVWRSAKFGVHWMNPVLVDGHLYGVDGETDRLAELVCFDANDGTEKWRESLDWQDDVMGGKLGIQRASLLYVDGGFLCLGELGSLHWLKLDPQGCHVEKRTQLFYAPHSWTLPVVSHGLLYVMQHYDEQVHGKTGQRLLCFDLRG